MPDVSVRHSPHFKLDDLQRFGDDLRTIIAEELDVPEQANGRLTPNDIEISFHPHGSHDIGQLPIQIRIEAMKFPERLANKDERAKRIAERASKCRNLPKDTRLGPPEKGVRLARARGRGVCGVLALSAYNKEAVVSWRPLSFFAKAFFLLLRK